MVAVNVLLFSGCSPQPPIDQSSRGPGDTPTITEPSVTSDSPTLPWRGFQTFPSLYFAAEPEGEFSEEQIKKITQFELAIIEFRMGQFIDEFGEGLWAEGDLQGLMDRQVIRLKTAGGSDFPVLTYLNAKWAGSMFADQRELLGNQSLFLPHAKDCEGFIDYPLDVGETGATTGLEWCRWDFRQEQTREAFSSVVETATSGPADGIFFDNAHSVACDAEGEYSDMSNGERREFLAAQNSTFRDAFLAMNRQGKHPVLSTTMGFESFGGQVPWEDDCPEWEEQLLEQLQGVSFSRNNEFWMWNLGELASRQLLNSIEEADAGVPLVVHTAYFPSGRGCAEGCFDSGGNPVEFTEQEFLEFSVAAFLVAMSPGSFYGFSNMEAEPEGGGWFDDSWDYHPLYDEIGTGEPLAPVEVSDDGMRFFREFDNGSVSVDLATGEYTLDFD